MAGGLAGTDNPGLVFTFGVGNHQEMPAIRTPDAQVALLVFGVIRVEKVEIERIIENGRCLLKRDAVFGEIDSCFVVVPIEGASVMVPEWLCLDRSYDLGRGQADCQYRREAGQARRWAGLRRVRSKGITRLSRSIGKAARGCWMPRQARKRCWLGGRREVQGTETRHFKDFVAK